MGAFFQRMRQLFPHAAIRRGAAMFVDAVIVMESVAVALLFRFAGNVAPEFWSTFGLFALLAALAFVLVLNEGGLYQRGLYQDTLRYRSIYQEAHAGALVVPRWVLRVASACAIAAGGVFIADFAVGEILNLRPVPLSVIPFGALLAYVQLVAVRHLPRVFDMMRAGGSS